MDIGIAKLKPHMRKDAKFWDIVGKDARSVAESAICKAKVTKLEHKLTGRLKDTLTAEGLAKPMTEEQLTELRAFLKEAVGKCTKKVGSMPAVDPSSTCHSTLWSELVRFSSDKVDMPALAVGSAAGAAASVASVPAPAAKGAKRPATGAAASAPLLSSAGSTASKTARTRR